jgi:hypothetical protein
MSSVIIGLIKKESKRMLDSMAEINQSIKESKADEETLREFTIRRLNSIEDKINKLGKIKNKPSLLYMLFHWKTWYNNSEG